MEQRRQASLEQLKAIRQAANKRFHSSPQPQFDDRCRAGGADSGHEAAQKSTVPAEQVSADSELAASVAQLGEMGFEAGEARAAVLAAGRAGLEPALQLLLESSGSIIPEAPAKRRSSQLLADLIADKGKGVAQAEFLNRSIASLLADAPPDAPRARPTQQDDENVLHVPPARTKEIMRLLALPPPAEVRVLSWNIDGLDEVGGPQALMLRTLAVATDIARHRPIAALLQEVLPPALELLAATQVLGNAYDVIVPDDPPLPYYVAILLDRRRVRRLAAPTTVPFPTTKMGRQLLAVKVDVLSSPLSGALVLATAHLESTKDHAAERKKQLRRCFEYLQEVSSGPGVGSPPPVGAILAGDLNLRDEEVTAVQRDLPGVARLILDAWVYCGSPSASRWTWDTVENKNVSVPFSCRMRFDRMFFLSAGDIAAVRPKSAVAKPLGRKRKGAQIASDEPYDRPGGWRPICFGLVGKDLVEGLRRFPSDHWGILTEWAYLAPSQAAAEDVPSSVSEASTATTRAKFAKVGTPFAGVIDLDA